MVNTKTDNKPYFENLDALRFIAAMVVVISHGVIHFHYVFKWHWLHVIHLHLFKNGHLGVTFFFVLSGFLISWLLLAEKEKTGTIHLPYFYMRRVLRIWPVYFMVVVIGFLAGSFCEFAFIDQGGFAFKTWPGQLKWYLFFLANYDPYQKSLLISSLWSVAVEEQFYLLWPLVILFIGRKSFPYFCMVIILISFLARLIFFAPETNYLGTPFVMGSLGFGGLVCYYCIYSPGFLVFIRGLRRRSIWLLYLFLFGYIFLHGFSHIFGAGFYRLYAPFETLLFPALFAMVILEQTFATNSVFKIGKLTLFSRLGKISYGIYAYHSLLFPVVYFVSFLLFPGSNNFSTYIIKLSLLIGLTLAVSNFSYSIMEKKFLKLKEKFSKI